MENVRHNQAYEQETWRHNVVQEQASLGQANASQIQALAAQSNAQANQLNALTNQRAQNLAEEKWKDPLGGGQTGGLLENLGKTGKFFYTAFTMLDRLLDQ